MVHNGPGDETGDLSLDHPFLYKSTAGFYISVMSGTVVILVILVPGESVITGVSEKLQTEVAPQHRNTCFRFKVVLPGAVLANNNHSCC